MVRLMLAFVLLGVTPFGRLPCLRSHTPTVDIGADEFFIQLGRVR